MGLAVIDRPREAARDPENGLTRPLRAEAGQPGLRGLHERYAAALLLRPESELEGVRISEVLDRILHEVPVPR